VLARRAGTGLAAGAVTIVAFPITQIYGAHPGAIAIGSLTNLWWPLASAAALVALVAAAPAVVRAARLRPQAAGPAGDLLADLGRLQPVAARNAGGSVNRLAFVIGTGLAIVIALAGVAANDPYDGILRGLLEASAFFGGYAISESGVEATPIKDRRSSPLSRACEREGGLRARISRHGRHSRVGRRWCSADGGCPRRASRARRARFHRSRSCSSGQLMSCGAGSGPSPRSVA
jgi:hypothetical protein